MAMIWGMVWQDLRLLKRERNIDQLLRQLCCTMEREGRDIDVTGQAALAVLLGSALIDGGVQEWVMSRPTSRDAGAVAWGVG